MFYTNISVHQGKCEKKVIKFCFKLNILKPKISINIFLKKEKLSEDTNLQLMKFKEQTLLMNNFITFQISWIDRKAQIISKCYPSLISCVKW